LCDTEGQSTVAEDMSQYIQNYNLVDDFPLDKKEKKLTYFTLK